MMYGLGWHDVFQSTSLRDAYDLRNTTTIYTGMETKIVYAVGCLSMVFVAIYAIIICVVNTLRTNRRNCTVTPLTDFRNDITLGKDHGDIWQTFVATEIPAGDTGSSRCDVLLKEHHNTHKDILIDDRDDSTAKKERLDCNFRSFQEGEYAQDESKQAKEGLGTLTARDTVKGTSLVECQETSPVMKGLRTSSSREHLMELPSIDFLQTMPTKDDFPASTAEGLQPHAVRDTPASTARSLKTHTGRGAPTSAPKEVYHISVARKCLEAARDVQVTADRGVQASVARDVQTSTPREWLQRATVREWSETTAARGVQTTTDRGVQTTTARGVQISAIKEWLQISRARNVLQASATREGHHKSATREGHHISAAREGDQITVAREGDQITVAREGDQITVAREGHHISSAREGYQISGSRRWLHASTAREGLQTFTARKLRTPRGWLQRDWLQTSPDRSLQSSTVRQGLQTSALREGLQRSPTRRLQTSPPREWLQTKTARGVLTSAPREWLRTSTTGEGLQTSAAYKGVQTSTAINGLHASTATGGFLASPANKGLPASTAIEILQISSDGGYPLLSVGTNGPTAYPVTKNSPVVVSSSYLLPSSFTCASNGNDHGSPPRLINMLKFHRPSRLLTTPNSAPNRFRLAEDWDASEHKTPLFQPPNSVHIV